MLCGGDTTRVSKLSSEGRRSHEETVISSDDIAQDAGCEIGQGRTIRSQGGPSDPHA